MSPTGCPVDFTSRVVDYLAGQSAGRCGPCLNGLPALAGAVRAVADGTGGTERVEQLAALVVRRGACAHPDGTVRLVRSMLAALPGEVAAHGSGRLLQPGGVVSAQLRVDWPACRAAGSATRCCPSWSTSTSGATRSSPGRSRRELLAEAREAVRVCPRLALRLQPAGSPARPHQAALVGEHDRLHPGRAHRAWPGSG